MIVLNPFGNDVDSMSQVYSESALDGKGVKRCRAGLSGRLWNTESFSRCHSNGRVLATIFSTLVISNWIHLMP